MFTTAGYLIKWKISSNDIVLTFCGVRGRANEVQINKINTYTNVMMLLMFANFSPNLIHFGLKKITA